MFDCILYCIPPERTPTPLATWAAQEAKSESMAADLVSETLANIGYAATVRRRAMRRRRFLLALTAATALAVCCL